MSESQPTPPDLPVVSNGASAAAAAGDEEEDEDSGPLTAEKIQRHLWDTVRKGDFVSAWYWLDQVRTWASDNYCNMGNAVWSAEKRAQMKTKKKEEENGFSFILFSFSLPISPSD